MQFASDNWAGAAPRIAEALSKAAGEMSPAYGTSPADEAIEQKFCDLFHTDLSVFFVATGTAANSLAIASAACAGGVAICHTEAHVTVDECGAPEFFSGDRLAHAGGKLGKITPEAFERALGKFTPGFVHHGRPTILTLTQATEVGTVYSLDEIKALAAIARGRNIPVHMDGARFANALVSLEASPAEMTWKAGVDLVSFGATKNGCWCAEALICFDPDKAEEIEFLRKRSGHLLSKSRFIAAQFDAYLADGYWMELAARANAMAARLVEIIGSSKRVQLAWEPRANEVFIVLTYGEAERLKQGGAVFYDWALPQAHGHLLADNQKLCRLVTSFATTEAEIEAFAELLAG